MPLEFPEKLRLAREHRGLTRERLCERLGHRWHSSRLQKWESGQGRPNAQDLADLSEALDVPFLWLISRDDVPPAEERTEAERTLLYAIRSLGPKEAMRILFDELTRRQQGRSPADLDDLLTVNRSGQEPLDYAELVRVTSRSAESAAAEGAEAGAAGSGSTSKGASPPRQRKAKSGAKKSGGRRGSRSA